MNNVYNIVKEAIDKKLQLSIIASRYYLGSDMINKTPNMLCKKAVAVKFINEDVKIIQKINNYDDYINIVKKGAISIYEPVNVYTTNFRIGFDNDLSKTQLFDLLITLQDRFANIGFSTDIIKYDNKYGIRCVSDKQYNTDKLYAFASNIAQGLSPDLSELKFGKIKRFCYSLNDDGIEDSIIYIGQQ